MKFEDTILESGDLMAIYLFFITPKNNYLKNKNTWTETYKKGTCGTEL